MDAPAPPRVPMPALAPAAPDAHRDPVRPLDAALWTMEPDPEHGFDPVPLRGHLSTNEWRRISGFRDPAHAWSSAATRAMLRLMLSRFHGADPLAWHFLTEPGGRPHVDAARAPFAVTAETRPHFSLSHTRGLAACMVSLGPWPAHAELGVDVEFTDRTLPAARLARRFFHPDEAAALEQEPRGPRRHHLFLTLWTRKEAVLKALGLGIANHLALYSCTGDPAAVSGAETLVGAPTDWQMGGETVTPRHRLSWAVRNPAAPGERVRPVHLLRRHVTGWTP